MIHLYEVKKNYGVFSLNVTMDIKPGKVTGIIGKNGAGKTTTFKTILGLTSVDSGSIEILGKKPSELKPCDKQNIGVVLADSYFSSYLTINEIKKILCVMYDKFDTEFFIKGCTDNELPLNKRIQTFSTGMKVKLKVLSAISHHPQLLILDEPTAGLDIMARNELLDMLRDYMEQDESRSILISSHISSDLEGLCDDIYLIDHGSIILHEDTDVLLDKYAVLKVSREQFTNMDKRYIVSYIDEKYGYKCLTKEKQFYTENYKDIVIEKGNIDDLMIILLGGKKYERVID